MKVINRILSHPPIKKKIQNWRTPKTIRNIGQRSLPLNSKRAAVIYVIEPIVYYVSGKLESYPHLNSHSMMWESVEIVRVLNEFGYIVDYFDCFLSSLSADWEKYDLIIDERNNLKDIPCLSGQRKVFYATGGHWLFQNISELNRISEFHRRNNIYVPPRRQTPAIDSDLNCDYLTYLGTDFQEKQFSNHPHKCQLNISAFVPHEIVRKDASTARENYIWIGSSGTIHKGLDLAVEAFCKMKRPRLYIFGRLEREQEVKLWLDSVTEKNKNIIYCGYGDVTSSTFSEVANNCIGVIGSSCSEGGGGAVCQVLHFGLIPIVTRNNTVRAEHLGYILRNNDDTQDIIDSIVESVQNIMSLSDKQLQSKSNDVRDFALEFHTRESYSNSFRQFIASIH